MTPENTRVIVSFLQAGKLHSHSTFHSHSPNVCNSRRSHASACGIKFVKRPGLYWVKFLVHDSSHSTCNRAMTSIDASSNIKDGFGCFPLVIATPVNCFPTPTKTLRQTVSKPQRRVKSVPETYLVKPSRITLIRYLLHQVHDRVCRLVRL